jgi:hypothetical protein
MIYLPTNPCCDCDPIINSCGNDKEVSSNIVYDGPTLPTSGVKSCDTINVALQKIDEVLTKLVSQQFSNTNNINLLINQVNSINSEIIEINNNCCP